MLKLENIKLIHIVISVLGSAQGLAAELASLEPALETMVVTGTRTGHESWDSPVPTTSISVEDARNRGLRNLADVLAEQPGMEVIPAIRGQTIRLQGFDSKYVLILVDGQRMTGKMGETFDLNSISLDQVERVEVVKGAGSSLYGSDAIAGVVNVILRKPLNDHQEVRLSVSSDQQVALGGQISWVGKTFEHSLNLGLNQSEPVRRSQSPATSWSGVKDSEIFWHQNWQAAEGFKLSSRIGYQTEIISGTDVSAAGAVWDRENNIHRLTLHLGPELRFDNGSILKLDSQYQSFEDVYEMELRLRRAVNTKETTQEDLQEHTLTYQHELGRQHYFTWGATQLQETLESDRLKTKKVDRQRLSLFVQDEWSLESVRDLILVPGVRLDDDDQFGQHSSGKLALRYAFTENTILRSSFGEGFRAPAFKELYLRFENTSVGYDVTGFDGLKPERSKSFQLALDHRMNLQHSMSLSLFQNEISELIGTAILPDQGDGLQHYSYRNVARAQTRGGDWNYKWMVGFGDLNLNYQFMEARDLEADISLEGRARHTMSFQWGRIPVGDLWQLNVSGRFASPQILYSAEGQAELSKASHFMTAGAVYQHSKTLSGGLSIENLTNTWEDRIMTVRPRSYVLSLHWNHQNTGKE